MALLIPFHVIMLHMVQWTLKEYVKNHKTFWFQLTPFPLSLSLDTGIQKQGVGAVGKERFMLKALAHYRYIIYQQNF